MKKSINKRKIVFISAIVCVVIALITAIVVITEDKDVRFLMSKSSYRQYVKEYKANYPKGKIPKGDTVYVLTHGNKDIQAVKALNEKYDAYSYDSLFATQYTVEEMAEVLVYAREKKLIDCGASLDNLKRVYVNAKIPSDQEYSVSDLLDFLEKKYPEAPISKYRRYIDPKTVNYSITYDALMALFDIDPEALVGILKGASGEVPDSITLREFVEFANKNIIGTSYESLLGDQVVDVIKQYGPYCSRDELKKKRSAKELSKILGIDKKKVQAVFLSKLDSEMSIEKFLDAAYDLKGTGQLSKKQIEQIRVGRLFVDYIVDDDKKAFAELLKELDIEEDKIDQIKSIYDGVKGISENIHKTPKEFLDWMMDYVYVNYPQVLPEEQWQQLEKIKMLVDSTWSGKGLTYTQICGVALMIAGEEVEDAITDFLVEYYYDDKWTLSMEEIGETKTNYIESERIGILLSKDAKKLKSDKTSIIVVSGKDIDTKDVRITANEYTQDNCSVVGEAEYNRQRKNGLAEGIIVAWGLVMVAVILALYGWRMKNGNLGNEGA